MWPCDSKLWWIVLFLLFFSNGFHFTFKIISRQFPGGNSGMCPHLLLRVSKTSEWGSFCRTWKRVSSAKIDVQWPYEITLKSPWTKRDSFAPAKTLYSTTCGLKKKKKKACTTQTFHCSLPNRSWTGLSKRIKQSLPQKLWNAQSGPLLWQRLWWLTPPPCH